MKDSPPLNTEATDDAPAATTAVAVATKRGATRLPPNRNLSAAGSAVGNGSALASPDHERSAGVGCFAQQALHCTKEVSFKGLRCPFDFGLPSHFEI